MYMCMLNFLAFARSRKNYDPEDKNNQAKKIKFYFWLYS